MIVNIDQYLILNNCNYFAIAEEFTLLTQLFKMDTGFEKLNFWIDMIIYPIITFISIIIYNEKIGIFSIVSIHKTVSKWQKYLDYLLVKTKINEWKEVIKSTGGPVISTNDDKYIAYVYADGMQRLHNRLFPTFFTKKSSKRL
jgi:hypothetical protein